jgi:hypothetical protein
MKIRWKVRLQERIASWAALWKACRIYEAGIKETEEKHRKDRLRYFMVFDPVQWKMVALTYDRYKGRADSYKYLVQRGRWKNRLSQEQMKELSWYYTPSKWAPLGMDKETQKRKKKVWIRYYFHLITSRGDTKAQSSSPEEGNGKK